MYYNIIPIIILILFVWAFIEIIMATPKVMEGLDANKTSEALQDLASVYNTGNAKLTNLEVTDGLKVNGLISNEGGANLKQTSFTGAVVMNNNPLYLRGWNDGNHGIMYNTQVDGPEVRGYSGGMISTYQGGPKALVTYNRDNFNINGNLIVNGRNILGELDRLNPVARCNWGGERWVFGDRGCEDDVAIRCENGIVTNFRFGC